MAYVELLKLGPIGLAGLMLILTIRALRQPIDERQERTLKQFLYAGSFCFFVACIFALIPTINAKGHMVYFRVEPMESGKSSNFPPPIVTINSDVLTAAPRKYFVESDVTAIIDVSDSINLANNFKNDANNYRQKSDSQRAVLNNIGRSGAESISKLQTVRSIALDSGCPGGSHGIAIPRGGDMAALSSEVISNITNTQRAIEAITP